MNVKRLYLSICGGVAAVALLAWASTPYVDYTVNLTHSLPGTAYAVQKGGSFSKGDLIAFRWHGGATYPAGVTFIKRVVGMPGDRVSTTAGICRVNGEVIGQIKPTTRAGIVLTPARDGPIRAGEYFVATDSPDSLDSRYALVGNIPQSAVIGRAYVLF